MKKILLISAFLLNNCTSIVALMMGGETLAKFEAGVKKVEAEGNAVARKIQAEGEGQAILLQAENEKKALISKAQAELEASRLQVEAMKIIGETAKKYPEYRHQQFISDFGEALKNGNIQKIIYVPTEANIPIVEAKK